MSNGDGKPEASSSQVTKPPETGLIVHQQTGLQTYRRRLSEEALLKVVTAGDVTDLTKQEQTFYYLDMCDALGMDPITQPFLLLTSGRGEQKKTVLYATKNAAEQISKAHKISSGIDKMGIEDEGENYTMLGWASMGTRREPIIASVAYVKPDGKGEWEKYKYKDKDTGALKDGNRWVPSGDYVRLTPEEKANAKMHCNTKFLRRAALTMAGVSALAITAEMIDDARAHGEVIEAADGDWTPPEFTIKVEKVVEEEKPPLEFPGEKPAHIAQPLYDQYVKTWRAAKAEGVDVTAFTLLPGVIVKDVTRMEKELRERALQAFKDKHGGKSQADMLFPE